MAFWIFKCNPDKYRLEDRLSDRNPSLTWSVTRYRDKIAAGDTVFLWITGDQRGIRAVMRVEEPPGLMAELESEQTYWAARDERVSWRVMCRLVQRKVNLVHSELRNVEGLAELSVFTGFQQATNFPVTNAQGMILMRLAGL